MTTRNHFPQEHQAHRGESSMAMALQQQKEGPDDGEAGGDEPFDFSTLFSNGPVSDDQGGGEQNAAPDGDNQSPPAASSQDQSGGGDDGDPGLAQVREILEAQGKTQEQIAAALSAIATRQEAPAAAPASPSSAEQRLRYQFAATMLPQPMVQKFTSEDPAERLEGLMMILTAVANHQWNDWNKEVTTTYQPRFQEMVQASLQEQRQARAFEAEFNGLYPSLGKTTEGKALARMLIETTAQEMINAGVPPAKVGWNADFRKKFEEKLSKFGWKPQGQQQQQQQQQPATRQPGAQVRRQANGARPTVDPALRHLEDNMASVLATAGIKLNA